MKSGQWKKHKGLANFSWINKGRLKGNSRKYALLCETSTFDIWPVNLSHSWTWLSWWNQQRATWNWQRRIPLCTCQTVLFRQQQADSYKTADVKGSSKNELISTGLWYSVFKKTANQVSWVHFFPVQMNLNQEWCCIMWRHLDTWAPALHISDTLVVEQTFLLLR